MMDRRSIPWLVIVALVAFIGGYSLAAYSAQGAEAQTALEQEQQGRELEQLGAAKQKCDEELGQALQRISQLQQRVTALEEELKNGYLGVEVADSLKDPSGAEVQQVVTPSPASLAGIRKGDVITGIDGKRVRSADELVQMLKFYAPGTLVRVTFHRPNVFGGSYFDQAVVLMRRP